jgi:Domain of unknown function (DUF4203)
MLPQGYEGPAALLLLIGGALACFAGYRLFRTVLALYGFVLGAMLASSLMGATNTVGMVIAAVVGGIIGALILVFAYFVGIALVGAGLGALVATGSWSYFKAGDPPPLVVIICAVVGAAVAMVLQRYVIIFATSFAGAWTMIVGGLALSGNRAVSSAAAASSSVWILYPMSPALKQPWLSAAWIALGFVGMAVQFGITGRRR